MADKETSQKETVNKVMTKYDKKVQRRKEEEIKLKRERTIERIVGLVILLALVIGLVSIPVKKYVATHATYITVGGHNINKVEFDYYQALASKNYINAYGSYLSYMGLDVNKDYAKQAYSDTMSWKDYFDQLAVDNIKQNKALYDKAMAEGFTYDPSADFESFMNTIKLAAKEGKVTTDAYLKSAFGQYITEAKIKGYAEETYIVEAYYNSIADTKEPSEDEIKAYYDENTDTYDSVDFLFTEVKADIPASKTVTDGDGKATTIEPTEEEIKTAMNAAKKLADDALLVIEAEGTEKLNQKKNALSYKYSEWLYDEARKAGDTTVIEDTDNNKYYVLQFNKRYLEESKTINVRAITTAEKSGEEILAEWTEAGGTEEAFIKMVEKYSEDTTTVKNGGLFEELTVSSLTGELKDWLGDSARNTGDTTTITAEGYNYTFYFLNAGRFEWQASIASTLKNQAMNDWVEECKSGMDVQDPKGHLVYLKVQEQATATPSETTPEETTPVDTTSTASETTPVE